MVVQTEGIQRISLGERGEILNLGAKNLSALNRMASHIAAMQREGEEIPRSPFIEWGADRVCGMDRLDLIVFLQGRRGSGKSYTGLYWGQRFAEAIARRKGGKWQDYFNLSNCATLEHSDAILNLLRKSGKNQVILIDDASLAISNRQYNSPENKNWNALLSVCRTRRWIMILTAPLKQHTDRQTRDMTDLTATVTISNHDKGWNAVKISKSYLGASGKEYNSRLKFAGKRIDYVISLRPDRELLYAYDQQRDAQAIALNERIIETGSFKPIKEQKQRRNLIETKDNELYSQIGNDVRAELNQPEKQSINSLAVKFGVSHLRMNRLVNRIRSEGTNGED